MIELTQEEYDKLIQLSKNRGRNGWKLSGYYSHGHRHFEVCNKLKEKGLVRTGAQSWKFYICEMQLLTLLLEHGIKITEGKRPTYSELLESAGMI